MFIGHFAVAFGIKRAAPEVGLSTAIVAASFLDLVWPVLVAAGIEVVRIDPGNMALSPLDFVSYPYSHSLAMTFAWAALFAWVYRGRAARRAARCGSGSRSRVTGFWI